jgi:periplasmic divalent cation tolerance protein
MQAAPAEDGAPGRLALVLTTVPGRELGERLVRQLVDERLIACANLIPGLASIFRWQGEVRSETEVLILMKTQPERLEALFQRVQELHPYEVPELIEVPVGEVSPAYCQWILAETGEAP